ncbi:lysophospholipid acyltransferase family protein [Sphingobium sp. YR768]|uniref:lysophospholipid acyltransferase family protein n=1 Tax=Sphingobium sp. YR768 TaxID=1884365 RepID=UPI0008B613CC|nr:lauroyl acyltransferase [Sphingobium sp. YR768]SER87474.1 KDO2-lipid IV(A) lauroyltransferase [Sphingobium sp. YR768]
MLSNPFLFFLMRWLPAPIASWLGGWLSVHVARRSMKLRDARARANLAMLRPDLPEAEREAILTRRWVNVGRTMAELANIDRLVNDAHVTVIDKAAYQAVLDGPGPMIAFTAHLGNWDLLAAHIKWSTDRPGLGVYEAPDDPKTAAQLKKARSSYMGEAIGGEGAARGVLKHLTQKDRATLYILADERRDRQVWFPTFGRPLEPSGNLSIALRLARKVGATFLPFYLIRTSGPHFELHWRPPLDPATMSDAEIIAALDDYLGQACVTHADQWLALHDMDLAQPGHLPATGM